jgi:hypothetical protein
MTSDERSLLATLHEATHRIPGVPDHADRPAGHHGDTHHGGTHHRGRTAHASTTKRRSPGHPRNHSPGRPPRVLVAWQRRIAALFGQDLR